MGLRGLEGATHWKWGEGEKSLDERENWSIGVACVENPIEWLI